MHLSSPTQELGGGSNRDRNVMPRSSTPNPNRDYGSNLSEILTMPKITGAFVAVAFGNQLECIRSFGDSAPPIGTRCHAGVGLTGACFAEGKIQLCNDTENDSRADLQACADVGVRSVLVVPIRRGSTLSGVVEVLSSEPSAFDWRTIRHMNRIARLFAAFTLESCVQSPERDDAFEPKATASVRAPASGFDLQKVLHAAWLIQNVASAIASAVKDPEIVVEAQPVCQERQGADLPVPQPVTEIPAQPCISPPTFGTQEDAAPSLGTLEEEFADKGRRRRLALGIAFVILFACFLEFGTHPASLRTLLGFAPQVPNAGWRSSPAALRKYPHNSQKADMQSGSPSQNDLHAQGSAPSLRTPIPQSSAGAIAKFKELEQNGDADASWNLGLGYLKGVGVPQDDRRAAKWLKKAANLGSPLAQAALSDLYLRGIGVQRDYVRAYTWASIAAGQLGGEDERLAAMRQRMTRAELEDANRRVQTWFAQKGAVSRQ
jgi:hypothetical protein